VGGETGGGPPDPGGEGFFFWGPRAKLVVELLTKLTAVSFSEAACVAKLLTEKW